MAKVERIGRTMQVFAVEGVIPLCNGVLLACRPWSANFSFAIDLHWVEGG